MATYNHPGVFIEEISTLPPSVAPVSTAIPAFIGYTQLAGGPERPFSKKAIRIKSLPEYEFFFGKAANQGFEVKVEGDAETGKPVSAEISAAPSPYLMYYQVSMYFLNGGGPCYIISVGDYQPTSRFDHFTAHTDGLAAAKKNDEITLLLFPDAESLISTRYYDLYKAALTQCEQLKNRFTIIDVKMGIEDGETDPPRSPLEVFRARMDAEPEFARYGAAYYPKLQTTLSYAYKIVESPGSPRSVILKSATDDSTLASATQNALFSRNDFEEAVKRLINKTPVILPPSGAIAGVFAWVDRRRGVFKSPANISLNAVSAPDIKITDEDHHGLNIHTTGKSINAIRAFTGKGVLVWGARTLDGNSNEWRYVSVRRFFIFVEESLKKAVAPFVFEPNDITTWTRVKGLIDNFLLLQWRAGALAGSTPAQAYEVKIGLGETMTAQDILEGRLHVEVGLAVARPAEFIYIRFSHKIQEA